MLGLLGVLICTGGFALSPYDNILITFDPACENDGHLSLSEYIEQSIKDPTLHGLNELIQTDLNRVVSHTVQRFVRFDDREEAIARKLRRTGGGLPQSSLGNIPELEREDELLATLHMMAVLDLAHGDASQAKAILRGEQENQLNSVLETLGLEREREKLRSQGFLTKPVSLEFLPGMKIIGNPVLGPRLLELARYLPCLLFPPEHDAFHVPQDHVVLQEQSEDESSSTLTEPVLQSTVPEGPTEAQPTQPIPSLDIVYDVIDSEILAARMAQEKETGITSVDYFDFPHQIFNLTGRQRWDMNWHGATLGPDRLVYGLGWNSAYIMLAKDFIFAERPELKNQEVVELTYDEVMDAIEKNYKPPVAAVLDTGCDKNNAELSPTFWRVEGCPADAVTGPLEDEFYPGACIGYDTASTPMNPDPTVLLDLTTGTARYHGSMVAGAVVSRGRETFALGGCPWCKLMCLKVFKPPGSGPLSASLYGIDFTVKFKADLANLSYGRWDFYSYSEEHAFIEAARRGVFVTISAGNEYTNSDIAENLFTHLPSSYAAAIPGVVSVGSTNRTAYRAGFSNYGPKTVEVFAPGQRVLMLNEIVGSVEDHGTSYSSPFVLAVAGILKTKYPDLSPPDIENILRESAMPSPYLVGLAVTPGVVSAPRALAYADMYVKTTSSTTTESTTKTATTQHSGVTEVVSISFLALLLGDLLV